MSKKVLITGVSGGIGAAIAKKFIKNRVAFSMTFSSWIFMIFDEHAVENHPQKFREIVWSQKSENLVFWWPFHVF